MAFPSGETDRAERCSYLEDHSGVDDAADRHLGLYFRHDVSDGLLVGGIGAVDPGRSAGLFNACYDFSSLRLVGTRPGQEDKISAALTEHPGCQASAEATKAAN